MAKKTYCKECRGDGRGYYGYWGIEGDVSPCRTCGGTGQDKTLGRRIKNPDLVRIDVTKMRRAR